MAVPAPKYQELIDICGSGHKLADMQRGLEWIEANAKNTFASKMIIVAGNELKARGGMTKEELEQFIKEMAVVNRVTMYVTKHAKRVAKNREERAERKKSAVEVAKTLTKEELLALVAEMDAAPAPPFPVAAPATPSQVAAPATPSSPISPLPPTHKRDGCDSDSSEAPPAFKRRRGKASTVRE